MADVAGRVGARRGGWWRVVGWGLAALILPLPLVAMQFDTGVNWGPEDFRFAGILLLGVGIPAELTVRKTGNRAYRTGVGVTLVACFILLWLAAGVGIIGPDGDPANLMYLGVTLTGVIGALLARFRASGMALALFAMAAAQVMVTVAAIVARLGYPESGPFELVFLNGFFVALFVLAGGLFLRAAEGPPSTS